ncbi:hypothetical protein ZIOFF_030418 [Zingiber officinale]|uniref:Uncharacterized protein n=2 Tax=Zingiber officinale TaxID=94328 RepID=A0A8J5GVF8_ZINOF|nr:hypothetical protein ZIOFF_030418 [Zingiber officinale]
MSDASAELRPIQLTGSPPLREELQEVNEGAPEDADPHHCCRTPTSEESKLPPAPPNCPPAPRKRKWRRRRRRPPPPPPPPELIAAETRQLEQLFKRRDREVDEPTTTQAKGKKVRDSDHGS